MTGMNGFVSAIASGEYIIEHNTITGIKVCGPAVSTRCEREQVFVTVPRWATGVPGTLNLVVHNSTGHAVLRPWPSMEAQSPRDCEKIQYVQSMEIDSHGIMWVADVGRKYFTEPAAVDNSCPPKMVLLDVPTGEIIETYVFPPEVAPYDGAFLNDIVLDVPNQVAYLTSTGNNASDLGALVVYDRRFRRSRRFEDATTHANNLGAEIEIHGSVYTNNLAGFPVDGIALSPRADQLYYSPWAAFTCTPLKRRHSETSHPRSRLLLPPSSITVRSPATTMVCRWGPKAIYSLAGSPLTHSTNGPLDLGLFRHGHSDW